jgi:methylase of polypeptide subunit release factors
MIDSQSAVSTSNVLPNARETTALTRLLKEVAGTGYAFITPTPVTHQRYLDQRSRDQDQDVSLRDIFGWNTPFASHQLAPSLLALLQQAGAVLAGNPARSGVRIASLDGDLLLHSSFPTGASSSVYFGPDTYRFARFIRHALTEHVLSPNTVSASAPHSTVRILDVGCGSGAGGIAAARMMQGAGRECSLTLSDINPTALRYAAINAEVAGIPVSLALGDTFAAVDGQFDLIISNPPYLYDDTRRTYRHGGDGLGRALSVRIAREALTRLAPGGQLLLYTGVAIIAGADPFLDEMTAALSSTGWPWSYTEIDPDVFGEELSRPIYQHADRIAAVGLIVCRSEGPP